MVASAPVSAGRQSTIVELPAPDQLPDGREPEARVVVCGISWKNYVDFDRRLGDDRPGPRFYYLQGELEIMTTSNEHERIKKWISGLLDVYFEEAQVETVPRGQATMRLPLKEAGAEPDESWCIGAEKEFPDLVLEIALTTGGIPKLDVYKRFQVPEVWLWRNDQLEIYRLSRSGDYEKHDGSRLLPGLNTPLLVRCVAIRSWTEARRTFRAGLKSK